jgi:hypothetical protein
VHWPGAEAQLLHCLAADLCEGLRLSVQEGQDVCLADDVGDGACRACGDGVVMVRVMYGCVGLVLQEGA